MRGLLDIQEISKNFGGLAVLQKVSFSVEKGSLCGLIGPNGAGKSTLFNIISGLHKAETGAIVFEGRMINNLKPHQRCRLGIGRTFQVPGLFPDLTVLENVMLGAYPRLNAGLWANGCQTGLARAERRKAHEIASGTLDMLGLSKATGRKAGRLTSGQSKVCEIARTLAGSPRLLLLDEPAAGLNDSETRELGERLQMLDRELEMTVLIVDHDMNLVMGICDRVVVLDFGRKIAEGSPAEVQHDAAVRKAYLGY